MIEISVSESHHGPVFDGRAAIALEQFEQEWKEETARVGKNDVTATLDRVLRDPTPYYETRITTDRVGDDIHIWDGPNTFKYGPWLEGTGSRNATTRFKGYHTFRLVEAALEAKAGAIGERVLPRFLARME